MNKLLSLFLAFMFMLMPYVSVACEHETDTLVPSPVPSITINDLYEVSGNASIVDNPKFNYLAMIQTFSEDIVDCLPLIFWGTEDDRYVFFTLSYPVAEMNYDCFIIDADCNLIGNVMCDYMLCTCGEWWYDVNIVLAPGKYQPNQVVYLVWVE